MLPQVALPDISVDDESGLFIIRPFISSECGQ